ncbi:MAG: PstS family phosphate ABC transporter substrate-binding protein [Methanomassiliicoccales archaeon]|nr:PstS family phosphate ABC transporter substrate-binding protein [Methanomassiliicoccales archaeon]
MQKKIIFAAVAVVVVIIIAGLAVALSSSPAKEKTKVTEIGSDTMLELMQMCAEDFNDESSTASVSITGGGSGVGITKLIEGSTDVAQASRAMTDAEKQNASAHGIDPVEFKVAIDGIAIITNKDNSVTSLTLDQLANIYNGTYTNWNQVGGPDLEIVLYGRQPTSGTYQYFEEVVLKKGKTGGSEYSATMKQQTGNQQILSQVEQDAGAIGYVGVGYAKQGGSNIHVLDVQKDSGSAAYSPLDEAAVLNQSYALSRYMYLYTDGAPTGAVKEWVEFVLSSSGGQQIAIDAGFYALSSSVQQEMLNKLG